MSPQADKPSKPTSSTTGKEREEALQATFAGLDFDDSADPGDEDLEDPVQEVVEVEGLPLDLVESTAEEGAWVDMEQNVSDPATGKLMRYKFQLKLMPYESRKVQKHYTRMQEIAFKQYPKLQKRRKRARDRGEEFTLPTELADRMNRQLVSQAIVVDWQGIDLPCTPTNVDLLLERLPFLLDDILRESGMESNYLRLRKEEASGN